MEDFFDMGFFLIPRYPSTGPTGILIADGSASMFDKYLVQWRLSDPGINVGWSAWVTEETIIRPATPGSFQLTGMIYQNFFIGSGPGTVLSVATGRNELPVKLACTRV